MQTCDAPISSRRLLLVTAAALFDASGRVLISQRPRHKALGGLWEFPGGSVEFGERLADALRREIAEEYGVEIEVGALLDVVDHLLPDEGQHWVSPTFLCRVLSGEPVIREADKCAGIGWFTLDEVPANLTVVTQANLAHYRQRLAQASAHEAGA